MRKLSFSPSFATKTPSHLTDAADFLRGNDKMAALLPTLTRMATLQKQCKAGLPDMFEACEVLHFEAGQLLLSAPNAALATKLKQQLPKLQHYLQSQNWQVNGIRIKVQVSPTLKKLTPVKQFGLTPSAASAFAHLNGALESSPRNEGLKAALAALMSRYKDEQGR